MRQLKLMVLFALLIASLSSFAAQSNETQQANEAYYDILRNRDRVLDHANDLYTRQLAMKNIIDYFIPSPDGNWLTLKDVFLEIAAQDPDFFFNEMQLFPQIYNHWLDSLTLHWVGQGKSPYPLLKDRAIETLGQSIQRDEKTLEAKKNLLRKLKSLKPTNLD